jgi:hypothetical protein
MGEIKSCLTPFINRVTSMKDKIYFGKIDKWLTEKSGEESWLGVIVSTIGGTIMYAFFFWR